MGRLINSNTSDFQIRIFLNKLALENKSKSSKKQGPKEHPTKKCPKIVTTQINLISKGTYLLEVLDAIVLSTNLLHVALAVQSRENVSQGHWTPIATHRTAERCLKHWTSQMEEDITLLVTNSSPLKIGEWETTFLFGRPIFRGYVSFREYINHLELIG